jgi:hypothetical protein
VYLDSNYTSTSNEYPAGVGDWDMTDTQFSICHHGDGGKNHKFCHGESINDKISSVWNSSDSAACFFKDWHYLGSMFCVPPHNAVASFSSTWNDTFSSLERN